MSARLPEGTPRRAPSGRSYRIWPNGDGIEIFREDGARMHDAGSHVPLIPLIDVPVIAKLLAEVQP